MSSASIALASFDRSRDSLGGVNAAGALEKLLWER